MADRIPKEFRPDTYFDVDDPSIFEHQEYLKKQSTVFDALTNNHDYCMAWLEKKCKELRLAKEIKPSITIQACTSLRSNVPGVKVINYGDADQSNADLIIFGHSPKFYFQIGIETIILPENGESYNLMVHGLAKIQGCVFDLSKGSIFIDECVIIEPGTMIQGPAIIGSYCTIRHGAYIRGDALIGKHVFIRGEMKNVIVLNDAELCHPSYCGDSICGYKSHFGNQVTTANLGLLSKGKTIHININGQNYDTRKRKLGVILGDFSQIGCNTVTDPGTLIQKNTMVYPLSRLTKGMYGPNEIIKNKPIEKGVIERVPLR